MFCRSKKGPWYGGMPENETLSNWLKIIVILFFMGLQLVNFINESKSMVDSNFNLVKMEPNRVMELLVVNQSLLERLSLVISADNGFKSTNMMREVTGRLICVTTTFNLTNSGFGLKLINQRLNVMDLIPLDLGKSDRVRMVWKPGYVTKQLQVEEQSKETIENGLGNNQHDKRIVEKAIDKGNRTRSMKKFGPEYSSDNAGDGPVGKSLCKK